MRWISKAVLFAVIYWMASLAEAQVAWNVVLTSGDTLRDCRPLVVDKELFLVSGRDTLSVSPDSVSLVFRATKGRFWSGAGYGALAGAAVGAAVAMMSYDEPRSSTGSFVNLGPGPTVATGALAGAAGGFVIGGIIGAFNKGIEEVDLAGKQGPVRIMTLRKLWNWEK